MPAGYGFGGSGSINDPVACQGTITAPSDGALDLNAGLSLSGTGVVQLSLGALTNNDLISGISGGTLSVYTQYVGSGGTGSFTQSGGNNNVGNTLYLGYNAGDSGSYSLSGSGRFFTQGLEYIGNSGAGSFTQSGGVNEDQQNLYLGEQAGGNGTYLPQR